MENLTVLRKPEKEKQTEWEGKRTRQQRICLTPPTEAPSKTFQSVTRNSGKLTGSHIQRRRPHKGEVRRGTESTDAVQKDDAKGE